MTEAAYPIRKSLTDTKLSVVGDIEIVSPVSEDCRPTEEFKECVQEVIESRQKQPWTKDRIPLSVALDRTLNARGIFR